MPILDVEAADRAGLRPIDLAKAFFDGGATLVQLRAKTAASAALLDLARAIVDLAHARRATVIVNDRADIARLAGADGVHVGQDDLAPADVRRVVGGDAIVGLSTHTPDQMDEALREPIDYVAIGPVFGTTSKATGYDAIGLDAVRSAAAVARTAERPLVAIGGITPENGEPLVKAGADFLAVCQAVWGRDDPAAAVSAFSDLLG